MRSFSLSAYDADLLTASPAFAVLFERAVALFPQPKTVANWITGEVAAYLNESGADLERTSLSPERLVSLLKLIEAGAISARIAKDVLVEMIRDDRDPTAIVAARGLTQISDEALLGDIVEQVIAAHPGPAADIKIGKKAAMGFLMGQIMKATGGRANPEVAGRVLRKRLGL